MKRKMTPSLRVSLEQKMDAAALEYDACPAEDGARKQALYLQLITDYYFPLYDNGEEWTLIEFENCIQNFAPQKGHLSHYINFIMSKKEKNHIPFVPVKTSDGEKKTEYYTPISLEGLANGDCQSESAIADIHVRMPSPELMILIESPYMEWLEWLRMTREEARGNKRMASSIWWYRIFYAEEIVQVFKEQRFLFLNERAVFDFLNEDFLDYMLTSKCRTQKSVRMTPLKLYRTVAPGHEDQAGEIPLPVPADVSLAFLKKLKERLQEIGNQTGISKMGTSEAARSQRHAQYERMREEIFSAE